jgi:hypothetical protein
VSADTLLPISINRSAIASFKGPRRSTRQSRAQNLLKRPWTGILRRYRRRRKRPRMPKPRMVFPMVARQSVLVHRARNSCTLYTFLNKIPKSKCEMLDTVLFSRLVISNLTMCHHEFRRKKPRTLSALRAHRDHPERFSSPGTLVGQIYCQRAT